MPIFDQYEVEPIPAYSGSYMSKIINPDGNVFLNTSSFARIQIADSATSTIIANNFNGLHILYSTFRNFYISYDSKKNLRSPYKSFEKFINIFSDEIIFDSLVANPIEYSRLNVDAFVMQKKGISYNDPDISTQFNLLNIAPSSSVFLILGGPGVSASLLDGAQEQVVDNKWLFQFPFQSYFKKNILNRNKSPSFYFDSPVYTTITASAIAYGDYGNSFLGRIDTTSSINYFGQIAYDFAELVPGKVFTGTQQRLSDTPVKVNNLASFSFSFIIPPNTSTNNTIGPNIIDSYKLYYGFGKDLGLGPANLPQRKYVSFIGLSSFGGTIGTRYFGIIPRGWKYGLYSALPNNAQCIYRLGRFGQFRDLLEQRLLTATNNSTITKNLFFPIENTFVSGTTIYNQAIDYVTATNPDYNQYDSGIYDYYCRSGQPFFDRDNED